MSNLKTADRRVWRRAFLSEQGCHGNTRPLSLVLIAVTVLIVLSQKRVHAEIGAGSGGMRSSGKPTATLTVRLDLIGDNIAQSQSPRLPELGDRLAGIPVRCKKAYTSPH